MIFPLTRTTVEGAVYYQGEADAIVGGEIAQRYQCAFPRMIQAWRDAWHRGTQGETSPQFAFGFVQLSVWGDKSNPPQPGEFVVTYTDLNLQKRILQGDPVADIADRFSRSKPQHLSGITIVRES